MGRVSFLILILIFSILISCYRCVEGVPRKLDWGLVYKSSSDFLEGEINLHFTSKQVTRCMVYNCLPYPSLFMKADPSADSRSADYCGAQHHRAMVVAADVRCTGRVSRRPGRGAPALQP